ncbi:MAG: hypothetical protein HZB38_07710 [Planctomycetes bacterium]|nr:hypothetical protein [Planctomycetota bacterium]
MDFRNTTHLDEVRLYEMFLRHTAPYRHERLTVRVRYSRSAAFSGACYYRTSRLLINLGRQNRYPYALSTHVARSQSNRTHWWRELYQLTLADAYQLALFVYLHELFHFLVKAAGRNTRRKEAMCDRFAARVLVDDYGCPLRTVDGRLVRRADWDFQDLAAFVGGAPRAAQFELPLLAAGG